MRLFRCLGAGLAALAATLSPVTTAADDSALNKEGYWTVGRGSADSETCLASLPANTGAMFILVGIQGGVSFSVGTQKPMRRGKQGVLSTEAYSFDFEPHFSEAADIVSLDDVMNARALAALRLAKDLTVMIDGRAVFSGHVAETGLEGALDAVVACSEGKSGWWGPGVGADGRAESDDEPAPPTNAEGYWSIVPGDPEDPGLCTAVVPVDDGHVFALIADHQGAMTFAVGSDDPMRRGRKGRFATDAYAFDFRPGYDGDTLVYGEDLDSQAIFAIRRARTAKIEIDRRTLVDMTLEGSGHAAVMDDLLACARSQSGWWGEGAVKP